MAVEQIKHAITSLTVTTNKSVSNDMETDGDSLEITHINLTQPDLPSLIADLKHKIATIVIETCAMFPPTSIINADHSPPALKNLSPALNQCGSS